MLPLLLVILPFLLSSTSFFPPSSAFMITEKPFRGSSTTTRFHVTRKAASSIKMPGEWFSYCFAQFIRHRGWKDQAGCTSADQQSGILTKAYKSRN
jgi:hypothetical protein